jgi:Ni/Co efflux regulator RcnB
VHGLAPHRGASAARTPPSHGRPDSLRTNPLRLERPDHTHATHPEDWGLPRGAAGICESPVVAGAPPPLVLSRMSARSADTAGRERCAETVRRAAGSTRRTCERQPCAPGRARPRVLPAWPMNRHGAEVAQSPRWPDGGVAPRKWRTSRRTGSKWNTRHPHRGNRWCKGVRFLRNVAGTRNQEPSPSASPIPKRVTSNEGRTSG